MLSLSDDASRLLSRWNVKLFHNLRILYLHRENLWLKLVPNNKLNRKFKEQWVIKIFLWDTIFEGLNIYSICVYSKIQFFTGHLCSAWLNIHYSVANKSRSKGQTRASNHCSRWIILIVILAWGCLMLATSWCQQFWEKSWVERDLIKAVIRDDDEIQSSDVSDYTWGMWVSDQTTIASLIPGLVSITLSAPHHENTIDPCSTIINTFRSLASLPFHTISSEIPLQSWARVGDIISRS